MGAVYSHADRHRLVPAVYVFLVSGGRVLLSRRRNTGFEDGRYSTLAGHMDGGESVRAAAVREAREEAGVEVAPDDLEPIGVMHRNTPEPGHERVDFFLVARRWRGEPSNREPEKCDDLAWFPLDALPPTTIPYVRRALENWRRGVWLDSEGFDG
jgi:8-oxo-dGTP pyrophosphatase MutT (NUDIX family)